MRRLDFWGLLNYNNTQAGDFIKDYADEQYAESCKEWSAFAEHKCAGLSEANKKYLADIFEKASLLELAFWKMAYRNERMEENAK